MHTPTALLLLAAAFLGLLPAGASATAGAGAGAGAAAGAGDALPPLLAAQMPWTTGGGAVLGPWPLPSAASSAAGSGVAGSGVAGACGGRAPCRGAHQSAHAACPAAALKQARGGEGRRGRGGGACCTPDWSPQQPARAAQTQGCARLPCTWSSLPGSLVRDCVGGQATVRQAMQRPSQQRHWGGQGSCGSSARTSSAAGASASSAAGSSSPPSATFCCFSCSCAFLASICAGRHGGSGGGGGSRVSSCPRPHSRCPPRAPCPLPPTHAAGDLHLHTAPCAGGSRAGVPASGLRACSRSHAAHLLQSRRHVGRQGGGGDAQLHERLQRVNGVVELLQAGRCGHGLALGVPTGSG
jgi:hypothetical protein